MSGRLTDAAANAALNAETGVWLQHHTGAPGDGTANVSASFGSGNRLLVNWAAAVARAMTTTAPVSGTVTTPETISHWSLWTSQAGGTCKWTGNWNTPRTYLASDQATVNPGDLTLTYPA